MNYDEALSKAITECQKIWEAEAISRGKPMTTEFLEVVTGLCVKDFTIIFRHGFNFGQASTSISWSVDSKPEPGDAK